MADAEAYVAVRRKRDGMWLGGESPRAAKWVSIPRYLPSESKALMIVRVDLGLELDEVEIMSRDEARRLAN